MGGVRRAIILGVGSDIGVEISKRLLADGWEVRGRRHDGPYVVEPWDLIVCCYGTLEPIGWFWTADMDAWEANFAGNLFLPLRHVQDYYPHRRPGASVCFFSGAGTGGAAPTYSAYAASKIALVKMTELLDAESDDCKFFVLGPGVVRTKIHEQTLRAGSSATNLERAQQIVDGDATSTTHNDIYACLMACVAAKKAAIGGRNVYVPLDDWSRLGELEAYTGMFKLRRQGDEALRRSR